MERIVIDLWLDIADYKRLEKAAQAAGQTLDDWLHDSVMSYAESILNQDS